MKEQLTDLIVQRLSNASAELKQNFRQAHPKKVARHFALDNLLPQELALQLHAECPKPREMHPLSSFGECRLKYSHLREVSPLLKDINAAIQDQRVVAAIEDITAIHAQQPDPSRYAGGITALMKGHFINPHIDNSHDVDKKLYRTVNVLYYLSPQWQTEHGGNYELWDESIHHHVLVPYAFNRLVVMETNHHSWHAVSPVRVKQARYCIFNYFFSERCPEAKDYFNVTHYQPRPEQTFHRAIAAVQRRLFLK